ncbi:hypothetical protein WJ60_23320 [Burkholderia ubonensis]|nr:hypothetical protein WJ60_23320 [Burkholderia ubonensis]KVQ37747.1 hypothetical protein WK04_24610 [Burkholderia ubonensis]
MSLAKSFAESVQEYEASPYSNRLFKEVRVERDRHTQLTILQFVMKLIYERGTRKNSVKVRGKITSANWVTERSEQGTL